MKTRLSSVVAGLLAAIAMIIGNQAVAQAEPVTYCYAGQYCIYENSNFEQGVCRFSGNDNDYINDTGIRPDRSSYNCNDTASSYVNNGQPAPLDDIYAYRHANNTNERLWYSTRGEWRAWVSPCFGEPCNDQASAHKWT